MDPGKESGPAIVGATARPELKPVGLVGDSPKPLTLPPEARQALAAAASAALPVCELETQVFGTRQTWGTHARPGRIEARARGIAVLVRAAERAMQARPSLDVRHIEAALRSLAFSPSDLLVCTLSGKWISTREAVANRGQEISRALEELASIVAAVESGEADHG